MPPVDAARNAHWADHLPPERGVSAEQIAGRLAEGPIVVVLDDDPTGTQTVRDVPVLTRWSRDDIRWAFDQRSAGFFVLTNTRSLSAESAAARNRDIASTVLEVAAELGVAVAFASRSDSTLRGHYPLETDVLASVSAEYSQPVDGIVLSPAYIDAGRVTLDGVHWVRSTSGLTPVSDGEFARDATFGYSTSVLADWVEEKSQGATPATEVVVASLADIRSSDAPLRRVLESVRDQGVVVVDAVVDDDVRSAALSTLEAEIAGARLLYRVGPSFVRARLGQPQHPPISDEELVHLVGDGPAHGLVVVGSHVALTTRQLAALIRSREVTSIELDVARVASIDADDYLESLVQRAADALETSLVVISTSRVLVTGATPDESLDISRRVSAALTDTVRRTVARARPRFVIAKGGITSSDIATHSLQIGRAFVRGSLLPGIVSLWQAASGDSAGLPYVVFAGNVGDDDSLAEVVDRLEA